MDDELTGAEEFVREVVGPAIYPRRTDLAVVAHHVHGEPIRPAQAVRAPYQPFAVGGAWGGMWDTSWFRFTGTVPPDWDGEEVVALIHLGGDDVVGFSAEGLVWDRQVTPLQGLHHRHREFVVTPRAAAAQEVELFVEAAANPIPRWHRKEWPLLAPDYDGPPLYVLRQAELATADRQVEALYFDLGLLVEMARRIPEQREVIVAALERVRATIEAGRVNATAAAGRAELRRAIPKRPSSGLHRVTAVGHAHIDSAWLWPIRETKRKCGRTFANQVRLMERYPAHHFACSQAVQYQWVKEEYPAIYEEIRKRAPGGGPVGAGRGHVGRARHEHPLRRIAGAPVRVRPAVLRRRVRSRVPRALDPRCVRLLGRAPANSRSGRRHRPRRTQKMS